MSNHVNIPGINPTETLNATALTIIGLVFAGAQTGQPPSVRELMDATGIRSTNAIQGHLWRLRKLGLIDFTPARARTVRPKCRWLYV